MCLLCWGKTQSAFLLHFAAYAMACLGCSLFFVVLYNYLLECLASLAAKNNYRTTKLGHVPNFEVSTQKSWNALLEGQFVA